MIIYISDKDFYLKQDIKEEPILNGSYYAKPYKDGYLMFDNYPDGQEGNIAYKPLKEELEVEVVTQ